MMRLRVLTAAAILGLSGFALSPPAQAIGCLSGGVAGAIAGHLAHHGVLGAIGGCIAGHEYHKHQEANDRQAERQQNSGQYQYDRSNSSRNPTY